MAKQPEKVKHKRRKVDPALGWSVRLGGPHPYVFPEFFQTKEAAQAACTYPYHRPIKVWIVDARDYKPKK